MQRLWKKMIVVVGIVVVLVTIGSFLGRGSGWGGRRGYATGSTTTPIIFISPTLDSATTQTFTFNILDDTDQPVSGTLEIDNEDGTLQAPLISFTDAPHHNFQIPYTPPVGTSPQFSALVGAPFVPKITITPAPTAVGDICADVETRDQATGATDDTVEFFGQLDGIEEKNGCIRILSLSEIAVAPVARQ